MLAELGCDLAQGYVLSPPKPWPDLHACIAAHNREWVSYLGEAGRARRPVTQ